ncbi:TLC domain-containing protein [Xylaria sp. CBS 124048]|nr:TLC domain-containing protein [Xylaria sp. CBS 124048]
MLLFEALTNRNSQALSFTHRTCRLPLAIIIACLSLCALNPTDSNIGPADLAYAAFVVIVLAFTREFLMQEIMAPLARPLCTNPAAKQLRFMDQMYAVANFALAGSWGVYCMKPSPVWCFNTRGMRRSGCSRLLSWCLGMEERRKDFRELVVHHIVAIALIGLSYRSHFTYMGIAVFSQPKGHSSQSAYSCGFIYLRHYINLHILWSILTEFRTVGPYVLDWEQERYKCFLSNVITFVLAHKFVFKGISKENRSDGEEVVVVDDVVQRKVEMLFD